MKPIWLKNYQEGVPESINPDQYPSMVAFLEAIFQQYHNRAAFSNFGSDLSYSQLEQMSRAVMMFWLEELQLTKGDRVAIMLPNILAYPITVLGTLRAGCVVVNLNPLYTPTEVLTQLQDAEVKAVVVFANSAHIIQSACQILGIKHVVLAHLGDGHGWIKRHILNVVNRYIKKNIKPFQLPQVYSLSSIIRYRAKGLVKPPAVTGEDIAFLQYTGGTTGTPKGAMLTHRNILANMEQAYAWVRPVLQPEKEIVVTALPLYHIFSLLANGLLFLKLGAKNILITDPRDLKHFINTIAHSSFSVITGVNTLFRALTNHPDFVQVDCSRLKVSLGGGAPITASVAHRWQQMTGCPLTQAYGLTEASPAVAINPLHIRRYNSSVGLPVPSTEVSIRTPEDQSAPVGAIGELWIKGPQVMQGYWHRPKETTAVLKEGWLSTGDLAFIDEAGYLYIVDRIKDVILVSGFNVYPHEIEVVLERHPAIVEASVVGEKVADGNEQVCAYVVRRDLNLTEKDIKIYCRQYLTSYKIPRKIYFVPQLPKSSIGKVLRRTLKERDKNP